MTTRQFLFGLSGGVTVFALAGVFWLGLGISMALTPRTPWWLWLLASLTQLGGCVALLWAGVRLRKRSGFHPSELRNPDARQRAENRYIRRQFTWIGLGQGILIAAGVWWCVHANVQDRMWAWMALVVSLHFAPLASLFHVRAYYATAAAGALVSIAAFAGVFGARHVEYLSLAMAVVMWATGAYIVWRADTLAKRAMRDPWAT